MYHPRDEGCLQAMIKCHNSGDGESDYYYDGGGSADG